VAGWLRFIAFGFIKLLLALSLGVTFGGTFVVWVLYKVAVVEVEGHLSRPVWAMTGRVYSAPIELWTGLQASPESVAHALQSAGYARVPQAERPGDFQVSAEAVKVHRPAAEGPGWKVKEATVELRFGEGRIRSIEPPGRAVFAPAELSSVRGSGNEARRPVHLAEVPVVMRQAVLAMEDARFYEHEGLDPVGIGRAIFNNVVLGRPMQGGSTLTQQVVKNLFLTVERTYERKAREALLSVALERVRTKDQILELYLNEIYLGQVAGASVCGVDQASRAYFGRPIERISLGEAATLAGIVSAPNRYSPLQHPEAALERRDLALSRMAEVGFIRADVATAEQKRALELHPSAQKRQATWAVDAAIGRTEAELGEGSVAARGLSVYTDINPLLQSLAEAAVEAGGAELDAAHPRSAGAEIALVAVRVRDGAIVAMVGGRSYARSQFNRAVFGERQVGSTVKPITFLAAFEDDPTQSPATVVVDEPIERTVDGKLWAPQNYDGRYVGAVTWRRALDQSRNVPAVLVAEQVGLRRLDQLSDALGLAAVEPYPSSALGAFGATPAALAGAYTVFPGGGLVARPRLVRAVRDAAGAQLWGEEGGVHRVVSGRAAFLATSMLRTVVTEGTAHSAAKYGAVGALGGKTGTTDELRDAWFVGFSETLVTAVWVGFDRGRDLGLTGGEAA
jgi:penicillin-binding protein 1B